LLSGKQRGHLCACIPARLLKLLTKLAGPGLVRLSQSAFATLIQNLPKFFALKPGALEVRPPDFASLLPLLIGKVKRTQGAGSAAAHLMPLEPSFPSIATILGALNARSSGWLRLLAQGNYAQ
jgi:hypothetical protein